jgi:hypothetical protein
VVIETKTEREYVYRYIQTLQGLYNLTPRELDVAVAIVYRYRILEKARSKLASAKSREEYNPMNEVKKPATLKVIYTELGITFDVFRRYVSILKDKQFFLEGRISPNFIPDATKSRVEIWMQ